MFKKKRKKDLFSRIAQRYDNLIGEFNYLSIKKFIDLENKDILLDIGGGTGRAAKVLVKQVNQCFILDRSFEMLNEAKGLKNLFLIQGLSNTIPLREKSIDKIFLNDTIHHIDKQEETISQCFRILKNNGKLIIRDYDRSYFWNFFLILFEKIMLFKSKFLTPEELEKMVKRYNFSHIKIFKPSKATYILEGKKDYST